MNVMEQIEGAGKWLCLLKIAVAEDAGPGVGKGFALVAVFFDARDFGQHLVAAHTDQRAYGLEGDISPRLGESVYPGFGV